jgi:hypothetical protein
VDRLCASEEFRKSPRSQELLRYLCDHALNHPSTPITEHEIGVALFGWNRDKDPGADTIVRVQVSHLRKKLEHCFVTECRNEPVAIHIPRGTYVPVFELREQSPAEDLRVVKASPQIVTATIPARTPAPRPIRAVVIACVVTASLATAAFGLYLRQVGGPAIAPTPALDRFWSGFRNGRAALLVVWDANLVLFTDILGRMISLNDYRYSGYPSRQLDTIHDPAMRRAAENLAVTHMTGLQDATTGISITLLLSRYHVPAGSISARDFRMPQPDNLILLGHPKGNPWVQFFEDRLNFRYQFDFEKRQGSIVNRAPAAGEQAVYTARFGDEGYCVVACLPKTEGSGTVLLLFGSDMSSLEAGGRFVTSDASLEQLYRRMGAQSQRAPAAMEVLLKTRLLDNLARGYEVIAYRIPAA